MFELLFSPSGCVGRAVYWTVAILTVVVEAALIALLVVIVGNAIRAADPALAAAHAFPHIQNYTPEEQARVWSAVQSVLPEACAIGVALLVAIWVNVVIEIKRWHDRGMSGFWVLLRFLIAALQILHAAHRGTSAEALTVQVIILGIFLFQIIQLCFLPGVEVSLPQGSRGYSSGAAVRPGGFRPRGYAPQPPPPSSSGAGKFALGFFCALFLIGAVGAAYYLGYASVPNLASLRSNLAGLTNNPVSAASPPSATAPSPAPVISPPPTPPASHLDDNILNREHVESDSMTKTYGKDWVIADGERLNGITQVAAAPGMQVTIVYSNGGKNVPASSLPQEFLTQWGITPATLAAANQPKTNQ